MVEIATDSIERDSVKAENYKAVRRVFDGEARAGRPGEEEPAEVCEVVPR
jgi:hypothetical protein